MTSNLIARPRADLSGNAAINKMADDMRIAGTATESDLLLKGWTRQQLDRYGKDASRLARNLSLAHAA